MLGDVYETLDLRDILRYTVIRLSDILISLGDVYGTLGYISVSLREVVFKTCLPVCVT